MRCADGVRGVVVVDGHDDVGCICYSGVVECGFDSSVVVIGV